jgi:hypothetical protein
MIISMACPATEQPECPASGKYRPNVQKVQKIRLICGLAPRQGLPGGAQGPVVPAWPLCTTVIATLTSEAAMSTDQKMIAM